MQLDRILTWTVALDSRPPMCAWVASEHAHITFREVIANALLLFDLQCGTLPAGMYLREQLYLRDLRLQETPPRLTATRGQEGTGTRRVPFFSSGALRGCSDKRPPMSPMHAQPERYQAR